VKTTTITGEESDNPKSEEALGKSEKSLDSPPFKSKVPFPQRLAKPSLEAQFGKFIDMLKKFTLTFLLLKLCPACQ